MLGLWLRGHGSSFGVYGLQMPPITVACTSPNDIVFFFIILNVLTQIPRVHIL